MTNRERVGEISILFIISSSVAEHVLDTLESRGITVHPYDTSNTSCMCTSPSLTIIEIEIYDNHAFADICNSLSLEYETPRTREYHTIEYVLLGFSLSSI
jgi:hypothetical protein